ncbi:Hypothetical predicted protein [Paramuricea clavata]|uniref:Uncharacterized protein n=1 Tax=Paramuricea clavata TaxID=317549 RepID=A0A7D9HCE8_PARCT|nr:Hypothetical predicted protein [Paramuricea clavata]
MSKQLTLSGISFKPKPYFKNASTLYEKFINKNWSKRHYCFKTKQEFIKNALHEWDKIRHNENAVNEYLAQSESTKNTSKPFFQKLSCKADSQHKEDTILPSIHHPVKKKSESTDLLENAPTNIESRENYLKSHELKMVKKFLDEIGSQSSEFLAPDVLADESFMKFLTSLMYSWNTFFTLRSSYKDMGKYIRKSALNFMLEAIEVGVQNFKADIKTVVDIKCLSGMSATLLSQSYLKRAEALKNIILSGSKLNMLISDKSLLNSLTRRIKQQEQNKNSFTMLTTRLPSELVSCFCVNSSTLSWDEVFAKFVEDENSRTEKTLQGSTRDQITIATYLSENLVVSSEELGLKSEAEKLQTVDSKEDEKEDGKGDDKRAESNNRENKEKTCEYREQPSLVTKFPDIIDKTTEFIKQHGFAAQHRRRTSTGYSSGVTIAQIREHLMKEIPGLKEHGISSSTIRRLFKAPFRSRVSSARYKNYINVRVGTKSNSYREHHPDAHYLFARNKARREFATLFSDHVTMISTDDMAKIKVGAPAVSRYHQIQRFFPTGDSPNYSDHDFPVPNYLLSVSGYMVLQETEVENNDDVSETAQNFSNASTYDYTPGTTVLTQTENSVLEKFNIFMDESVNDLYEIIISQARTQLNVKTTKEEILDVLKEEKGIQVEYPDSRALLEAIVFGISSLFQTRMVLINVTDNTSVDIVSDNCNNEEAPIYICMKNEPLAFTLPVFCKESVQKFESLPINPGSLTYDNLGRLHLNTPYSGPAHVYICSSKYNGTVASHITDIHGIICGDD